ncbi:cupin domain-containing protein [Tomitella biformata]|uniref:cupin domain-containing protein n=1 Tax=Tomitella biformata TaxID=630403 RepID=UPI0004B4134C|nr:cupin domain-containing protein [Tomitella biformata]
MAIEYFNLLAAEEGWGDLSVDPTMPSYLWNDGGSLADAPVDMEKTFKGNMRVCRQVDSDFNLNGLRCAPGFSVPRHHHNLDELIIVLGGEFHVAWGKDGEEGSKTIGAGEFWISRAGTPYIMTAGPEGVTYLETWPSPMSELSTSWHDEGWAHR